MNKTPVRTHPVSIVFTTLLFLVFVLCGLFTVLIGQKAYEQINNRMQDNYTASTALNYIANQVRQCDEDGEIEVTLLEQTPVLQLKQTIQGEEYRTWIYYKDGYIRELFADSGSELGLKDGLEIVECEGLTLEQNGKLLRAAVTGEGSGELYLTVRSEGREMP